MKTKYIILLVGFFLRLPVPAADIVWINPSGGNWTVATNWNPNQVPGPGDTVWITNNGTYTVTLNATAAVTNMNLGGASGTQTLSHTSGTFTLSGTGISGTHGVYNLSGGTLNGSNTLTCEGSFNWSSGTLGSPGSSFVLAANGGLIISGGTRSFNGGTLVNGSTGAWTAGQITCSGTAIFSNAPGGTFDFQADGSAFAAGSGSPAFLNAGTVRKTAGTGTTAVSLPCSNAGSVQANSGTLALTLADGSGSFTANVGSTLSVSGTANLSGSASINGLGNFAVTGGTITNNGTYQVQGTNTFSSGTFAVAGPCLITNGTLAVNGGIVVFNGSGTVSPATLNLAAGSLLGSLPLTFTGPSTWTGGTLGSPGSSFVLAANGGLIISGGTRSFNGGTLVNGSTGAWTAGQITCSGTAIFSNAPGGTFDFLADGSSFVVASGSPAFLNAGTLRKTAGSGTTTVTLPCSNANYVQANSGTLALALADGSGSFTANVSSTLSVSGTANLSGSASINGLGNFAVTGGTITNNGTYQVQGTNTFSSSTFAVTGPCLVTNGTLAINGGGIVVFNGSGTVTPASLNLAAGSLLGNMLLTFTGPAIWTGGTLGSAGSSLVVAANGGLAISGGTRNFNGGTLINGSAGNWTAGQVICNGSAIFSNAPTATFDFQGDGNSLVVGSGSPLLANAGTLRKTTGSGTTTVILPCNNSGMVLANSGTLALNLTNSGGSFTANLGGTLSLNGTAILSSSASIDGLGNLIIASGAITNNGVLRIQGTNSINSGIVSFNGPCLVTNGTIAINGGFMIFDGSGTAMPAALNLSGGGNLLGSMTLTVTGPVAWTGGTLGSAGSSLVVAANGGLAISGGTRSFNGGTLINGGAGTWTGGQIICGGTAVFSNTPSGTLDFLADGSSLVVGSGSPAFINAGIVRKTSGTGTTTFSLSCGNAGSVQANSGTLALALADGSGSFTANVGSTLSVSGTANLSGSASINGLGIFAVTGGTITNNGTYQVQGTNTFSSGTFAVAGPCLITNGTLAVNGGIVVFNGSGTVSPATLNLASGSLLGSLPLTFTGPSTWTGGTLGSAGSSLVVVANGGLAISGGTRNFNGGTLVNGGAGIWTAGQVICNGSAIFSNTPSATFDFQADGNSFVVGSGSPLLANAGTLRKTSGAGTSTVTLPCNNSGSVLASSGTLSFGTFIQNTGQTVLNGGNFAFTQTAQLRGGILTGPGTVTGSVSNNATVSLGAAPGVLIISGNYTEGSGSHLQIKLGGTTVGTGYDQLVVGGTAKLAGALDISYWNGFIPVSGNVFTVLTNNIRSGGFSIITAPTNTLGTVYTPKTVLVEPGNASPTAQLTMATNNTVCHAFVIKGSAADLDGTVTNFTLMQDTNVLVSVAGNSAQITVSYDFPGDLTFTALATDNKGAQGATNVTVSITPLSVRMLDAIGFQTNRAFKLCMLGDAGTNYQVWASTNLAATNWTALGTMENTNGIWRFSDTTATNSSTRFYRARQLP